MNFSFSCIRFRSRHWNRWSKQVWFYLIAPLLFVSQHVYAQSPIDTKATRKTRALLSNLHHFAGDRLLIGHQDDLAYGVNWERETGRSDVKEVCGDYPAVFGWDVSKLGQRPVNIDSVNFMDMQQWIIDVFKMGGINTISWHMDNFATGGDSWDTTSCLPQILAGGSKHSAYVKKLDQFADFVRGLRAGAFNRPIPIIFRPFHEHTGSWFWWGEGHRSAEQYISIWRFTVAYLRDTKKLHNILYAYSPDIFPDKKTYLSCYPGDEYVDILGVDDYHDVSSHGDPKELTRRLRMLVELAEEKGKVAALTETGRERIPYAEWWTQTLLKHIQADPVATKIAWVLLWRNDSFLHHYVPFDGHSSSRDFQRFYADPTTWFVEDLPNMYRKR
ncbi:MAG: glycosyl hydrolase [Bacteroidota bacterium]